MIAYDIQVIGKVQGVWFRKNTKEQADSLGICGWVQNKGDGTVKIFAEGEHLSLEKFIEWCRMGPTLARVDELNIAAATPINYSSFEIKK